MWEWEPDTMRQHHPFTYLVYQTHAEHVLDLPLLFAAGSLIHSHLCCIPVGRPRPVAHTDQAFTDIWRLRIPYGEDFGH